MRADSPHQRNALVNGWLEIGENHEGDTFCTRLMLSKNTIPAARVDELENEVNFEIERSQS
jgi:hypothetical protein